MTTTTMLSMADSNKMSSISSRLRCKCSLKWSEKAKVHCNHPLVMFTFQWAFRENIYSILVFWSRPNTLFSSNSTAFISTLKWKRFWNLHVDFAFFRCLSVHALSNRKAQMKRRDKILFEMRLLSSLSNEIQMAWNQESHSHKSQCTSEMSTVNEFAFASLHAKSKQNR